MKPRLSAAPEDVRRRLIERAYESDDDAIAAAIRTLLQEPIEDLAP